MSPQQRKRWALLLLVVWLPVYLILAWWLLNVIFDRWGRLPLLLELPLYIVLAFAWAIPFRRVFHGSGR
ncbi:DUF2842 domain-containing protein [Paracoccus sp. Z118]|uniref:DUF2842 domain-containing protein n=1 Tax=Paracoccus sp. Z118 TaxID=2851017 RepID=UPI001C2CAFCE|nr:DUF2842 domain-containing protein [Paracoccus sp. Z118]MBV0892750.1 DUF2842 domain-containing protein [Paracoccus sp. Z118]